MEVPIQGRESTNNHIPSLSELLLIAGGDLSVVEAGEKHAGSEFSREVHQTIERVQIEIRTARFLDDVQQDHPEPQVHFHSQRRSALQLWYILRLLKTMKVEWW